MHRFVYKWNFPKHLTIRMYNRQEIIHEDYTEFKNVSHWLCFQTKYHPDIISKLNNLLDKSTDNSMKNNILTNNAIYILTNEFEEYIKWYDDFGKYYEDMNSKEYKLNYKVRRGLCDNIIRELISLICKCYESKLSHFSNDVNNVKFSLDNLTTEGHLIEHSIIKHLIASEYINTVRSKKILAIQESFNQNKLGFLCLIHMLIQADYNGINKYQKKIENYKKDIIQRIQNNPHLIQCDFDKNINAFEIHEQICRQIINVPNNCPKHGSINYKT